MNKTTILEAAVGAIAIGLVVAGCYAGRVEADNLHLYPFWKTTASQPASADCETCTDCAWTNTNTNNNK